MPTRKMTMNIEFCNGLCHFADTLITVFAVWMAFVVSLAPHFCPTLPNTKKKKKNQQNWTKPISFCSPSFATQFQLIRSVRNVCIVYFGHISSSVPHFAHNQTHNHCLTRMCAELLSDVWLLAHKYGIRVWLLLWAAMFALHSRSSITAYIHCCWMWGEWEHESTRRKEIANYFASYDSSGAPDPHILSMLFQCEAP